MNKLQRAKGTSEFRRKGGGTPDPSDFAYRTMKSCEEQEEEDLTENEYSSFTHHSNKEDEQIKLSKQKSDYDQEYEDFTDNAGEHSEKYKYSDEFLFQKKDFEQLQPEQSFLQLQRLTHKLANLGQSSFQNSLLSQFQTLFQVKQQQKVNTLLTVQEALAYYSAALNLSEESRQNPQIILKTEQKLEEILQKLKQRQQDLGEEDQGFDPQNLLPSQTEYFSQSYQFENESEPQFQYFTYEENERQFQTEIIQIEDIAINLYNSLIINISANKRQLIKIREGESALDAILRHSAQSQFEQYIVEQGKKLKDKKEELEKTRFKLNEQLQFLQKISGNQGQLSSSPNTQAKRMNETRDLLDRFGHLNNSLFTSSQEQDKDDNQIESGDTFDKEAIFFTPMNNLAQKSAVLKARDMTSQINSFVAQAEVNQSKRELLYFKKETNKIINCYVGRLHQVTAILESVDRLVLQDLMPFLEGAGSDFIGLHDILYGLKHGAANTSQFYDLPKQMGQKTPCQQCQTGAMNEYQSLNESKCSHQNSGHLLWNACQTHTIFDDFVKEPSVTFIQKFREISKFVLQVLIDVKIHIDHIENVTLNAKVQVFFNQNNTQSFVGPQPTTLYKSLKVLPRFQEVRGMLIAAIEKVLQSLEFVQVLIREDLARRGLSLLPSSISGFGQQKNNMEEGYKIYGMFDGEGNDFESLEEQGGIHEVFIFGQLTFENLEKRIMSLREQMITNTFAD